jgi:hypothetical protein
VRVPAAVERGAGLLANPLVPVLELGERIPLGRCLRDQPVAAAGLRASLVRARAIAPGWGLHRILDGITISQGADP